eukprot:scaffold4667_cov116-Isochrysis_galbana.AAC.1
MDDRTLTLHRWVAHLELRRRLRDGAGGIDLRIRELRVEAHGAAMDSSCGSGKAVDTSRAQSHWGHTPRRHRGRMDSEWRIGGSGGGTMMARRRPQGRKARLHVTTPRRRLLRTAGSSVPPTSGVPWPHALRRRRRQHHAAGVEGKDQSQPQMIVGQGKGGPSAELKLKHRGGGAPDKGRACGGPAQTGPHAIIGQAHWQASSYRATIYYTHTPHGTHTHDMHDIRIAFCVEKNHNDSNMIPGIVSLIVDCSHDHCFKNSFRRHGVNPESNLRWAARPSARPSGLALEGC